MIRKWIPMGLAAGLLAAVITGGAVLASCGGPEEGGKGDTEQVVVNDEDVSTLSIENTEVESGEPDELAVRIAEILGADAQATHDAMVQAERVELDRLQPEDSVETGDSDKRTEHATGLSYLEYGEEIGATLGLDGETVARAVAQAYEELYAVERDIREKGSGQDAAGKYEASKDPAGSAG